MALHPERTQLERYVDGDVTADEASVVAAHLEQCGRCERWVREARDDESVLPGVQRAFGRLQQASDDAAPPARIGGYRLGRRLGAGGMGVVYEAEQDKPRRRVALKLIRPGQASSSALRRFEFEAQVLGRLRHPGIAQIYEAGTYESGGVQQPFFAMELVTGAPLLTHVRGLDRRAVLELLVRICDAVHHAHLKGVVHRDLKPVNIRVEPSGQPKVLDFGVARVTDGAAESMHTMAGQLVGTLAYMSPEQVRGEPDAVDVRSDVYALGVIAFELLGGETPFALDGLPVTRIVQLVGEGEPRRLGVVAPSCKGDLDTIVGKALARAPAQRYQSAAELARDVERFLRDEPIAARPPGRWYLLRKFVRRNRVLVSAVAAIVLALSLGVVVSLTQMLRARAEARKATAINDYFLEILSFADPDQKAATKDFTVREAVDRAVARLEELRDQPEVEAGVCLMLGNAYEGLAQYAAAEPLLERALLLREQIGDSEVDIAEAASALAIARSQLGDTEAAEALHRRALGLYERTCGSDSPKVALCLNNVANSLWKRKRLEEAAALSARAVAICRARGDDQLPGFLVQQSLIAMGQQDAARSEALLREAIPLFEAQGRARHPYTANAKGMLAARLMARGELAAAEPLLLEALDVFVEIEGEAHPYAANARSWLVRLYRQWGKPEKAAAFSDR